MNSPRDRRRAPFLGLPVFETFSAILILTLIVYSLVGPIIRWLFR